MHSSRSAKNIQRIGRKKTSRAWRNKAKLPCLNKEGYPSKAAADQAITRLRRHGKERFPAELRSYNCAECGLWHIAGQS